MNADYVTAAWESTLYLKIISTMFNHQFPLSSIMLNHQPRKASSILGEKSREGPFINGMNMKVKVVQPCTTLCDPVDSPWNSPGQNTAMGSLSLLQGIFPTQGSNPGLPHCRQILYHWATREVQVQRLFLAKVFSSYLQTKESIATLSASIIHGIIAFNICLYLAYFSKHNSL